MDAVLKADGKLQAELNKLTTWRTPESLWPREDPRWSDAKKLTEQIDKLYKLLDADNAKRAAALAELQKSVEAVPASSKLPPADATAFADKVWQSLALDGPGLALDVRAAASKYTEDVQAHVSLFTTVRESVSDIDPAATGLKFKDQARQESIDRAHADLATRLQQNRERFFQFADQGLIASRQATTNPREERYQGFRRAYLRKQLEAVPKSIAALIERSESELKNAEKSTSKAAPTEVAFLTQRIKDLGKLREELKARTEAITKKAQAAK